MKALSSRFCFNPGGLSGASLLAVLLFICAFSSVASARPEYLKYFENNPYSNPTWHGHCSTCHINPRGGGERNAFGKAFDRAGHRITPELRTDFSDRFLLTPRSTHEPSVEFDPRNPNLIVVEMQGEKIQIDTATKSFKKLSQAERAPTSPQAATPPQTQIAEEPAPTVLDHYFVNLPSALPYARHSLNLHFTHRFDSPPFDQQRGGGASNLFGFDGISVSSFGLTYGITDRIAVTAYRSPMFKTIELGGEVAILQESKNAPFSLKAIASVEGRDNFKISVADRFLYESFWGSNFQIVVSRSILQRAEIAIVPTFSTHTRAQFDFFSKKMNTTALGLATSLKLTRRSALVAEYVPRLSGFKPFGTEGTVSLGIQRSTQRHVFALVVSKTQATTTGQQILGGNDFTVGFNIYRRIF